MEMNLSQLQEIVKDREDWHAQAHGVMSDSDWTTTAGKLSGFFFLSKTWFLLKNQCSNLCTFKMFERIELSPHLQENPMAPTLA